MRGLLKRLYRAVRPYVAPYTREPAEGLPPFGSVNTLFTRLPRSVRCLLSREGWVGSWVLRLAGKAAGHCLGLQGLQLRIPVAEHRPRRGAELGSCVSLRAGGAEIFGFNILDRRVRRVSQRL